MSLTNTEDTEVVKAEPGKSLADEAAEWDRRWAHIVKRPVMVALCGKPWSGKPLKKRSQSKKPICPICLALDRLSRKRA